MGLLNKLKSVLFEEEEVEIPETEVKEEIKEKPSKKKEPVKMTFQSDEDDVISDRELFKAEPTFNFPMFDESEFDSVKKEDIKDIPTYEKTMEVKTRTKSVSVFDTEKGRSRSYKEESYKRDYSPIKRTEPAVTPLEQRKFRPSPVISPVYGVLDKNYKKEDIVVRGEEKKVLDVDSVRKKAFGTLEDDIEKTLTTPINSFYPKEIEREAKEIDELLKETIDDEIPVLIKKDEAKPDYSSFNIEEEPIEYNYEDETLEVLDKKKEKSVEEKLEDDTLENDLFDLIDSMYENREDGE